MSIYSSTNDTGTLTIGSTNSSATFSGSTIEIGNASISNSESLLFVYGSTNQTATSSGPTNAVNVFNDIVGFKSDIISQNRLVLGNTNSPTAFIGLAYSTVITGSQQYTLRFPNAPPASNGLVLSADTNGNASWISSSGSPLTEDQFYVGNSSNTPVDTGNNFTLDQSELSSNNVLHRIGTVSGSNTTVEIGNNSGNSNLLIVGE
jgi:hypothetical protein